MQNNKTIDAEAGEAAHATEQTGARSMATSRMGAPALPNGQPDHVSHMLLMMERIAKNKEVDVAKMREVKEMAEGMIASQRREEYNIALAAAQAEMEPLRADANNPQTKSRYASYAAIDRFMRPIYTRHGFALTFDTEDGAPEGMVRVVCYATCRGHTQKHHIDLGNDGKGAKGGDVMTKTHAAGSAMTYGQRYLKKMIFDIAVDRDDDGNASSRPADDTPRVSQAQIDALIEKCEAVGCPRPRFLKWVPAERFEDIPAHAFDACIAGLNTFKKSGV